MKKLLKEFAKEMYEWFVKPLAINLIIGMAIWVLASYVLSTHLSITCGQSIAFWSMLTFIERMINVDSYMSGYDVSKDTILINSLIEVFLLYGFANLIDLI